MQLANAEAWQAYVEQNSDPYGAACVHYAERWADLMEAALATGQPLEAIAAPTSRTADTEGITGFMYGLAVAMLVHCWQHGETLRRWHNLETQIGNEGQHGETLRRWHNLETQIGNEGEQANASGGVLNPAVMHMGPPT